MMRIEKESWSANSQKFSFFLIQYRSNPEIFKFLIFKFLRDFLLFFKIQGN